MLLENKSFKEAHLPNHDLNRLVGLYPLRHYLKSLEIA